MYIPRMPVRPTRVSAGSSLESPQNRPRDGVQAFFTELVMSTWWYSVHTSPLCERKRLMSLFSVFSRPLSTGTLFMLRRRHSHVKLQMTPRTQIFSRLENVFSAAAILSSDVLTPSFRFSSLQVRRRVCDVALPFSNMHFLNAQTPWYRLSRI